jgi:hypothetical protein
MDDSTLASPTVLVPSGTTTYTVTVQGVECVAIDDIDVSCQCDTVKPYIFGSASIDTTEYTSDSTFRIYISELVKCNTITGASDFGLDCTSSTTAAACLANSIISATGDGCPNPPDSTAQWISIEMDKPVPSNYVNDWKIKISGTCTIRDVCWNLMTSVGSNGASGSAVILPIELLYFDGNLVGDAVVLNWETTLEVKTDHYVIQRSTDGKQFVDIGAVTARGTYYQYKFTDFTPAPGINYYRLKVVDTDGVHSFTRTIAVKIGEIKFELVSVKPIPTMDNVNVTFNSNTTEELSVEVLNLLGKQMHKINYIPQVGTNEVTLDLVDLKAGVYFLSINNGSSKNILTKVVKQ